MSIIWAIVAFFGFIAGGLIVREVGLYLPTIARWQLNRAVSRVSEEFRAESREKWFSIEAKLPGDLTKVLWGLGCNFVLARVRLPNDPENVAKIVHAVFFYIYLKLVLRDLIRLKFASPKTLRLRWLAFKKFADQAIVASDPNAPQPLLELAQKLQRLAEIKQQMEKLAEEAKELSKNLWK